MQFSPAHSEDFDDLQRLVNNLFMGRDSVDRFDMIVQADILDLSSDMREIAELVPAGNYTRQRLCDELNSALAAHGWGAEYGMVE